MSKKEEDSLMAAVMKGFKAAGIMDSEESVTKITDYFNNMKYIDMYDPVNNRPCMAMEWMLGARGFPAGKVYQLRASFSSGKSSFLYYVYACALRGSTQKDRKAWVAHIETEGAPNPPDYIARFGVDPNLFMYVKANGLNDLFKRIDTFDMALHGGRDGTVNPETGRVMKSKFTKENALDPDMKKTTIVGIDSLSNVGSDAGDDFVDLDKSEKPGGDSKDVRRFFRAREQDYDRHQLTMFVTTHETTEIKTGGAGYGGPKPTARNQKALGMALTVGIQTFESDKPDWKNETTKEIYGSKQHMTTFKSKLSPRNRHIVLYRKLLGGYDLAETDLQFFMGDPKNNNCTENPFMPGGFLCPEGAKCGITKVRGGYSAPMISDKVFKSADEFIEALYSDKDRLRKIRECLRIRGFGFDFETKYFVEQDEDSGMSPDDIAENAPVSSAAEVEGM